MESFAMCLYGMLHIIILAQPMLEIAWFELYCKSRKSSLIHIYH